MLSRPLASVFALRASDFAFSYDGTRRPDKSLVRPTLTDTHNTTADLAAEKVQALRAKSTNAYMKLHHFN